MEEKEILISIVIPVKNGATWLHDCLQAIIKQTLFYCTEIIVIDSGSTDGTLELLNDYPVTVLEIEPASFNHGLTRNYGVQHCQGEYVVMTVQDAIAKDNEWLESLLQGFSEGENVAAVCGQQVVPHHQDKNPVDWHRPQSAGVMRIIHFVTQTDFEKLSPFEKMAACGWDNVNAMYKKEILQRILFVKISYGEDAAWAKEALLAGYTLVYTPFAKVFHYHNENRDYSFKRALTAMYLRYRLFKYIPPVPRRNTIDILRQIKTIWVSKPLSFVQKWRWLQYNKEQFKGKKAAYKIFTESLAKGDAILDKVHHSYCETPPVPLVK